MLPITLSRSQDIFTIHRIYFPRKYIDTWYEKHIKLLLKIYIIKIDFDFINLHGEKKNDEKCENKIK